MESPSPDDPSSKKSTTRSRRRPKILRLRNEVALIIVALSISGAMVIVPRPTYPQVLPLPSIDRAQVGPREREEILLALSVRDGSLDKETRAVGEMFRRAGRALSVRSSAVKEVDTLRRDAAELLKREASAGALSGVDSLLRLRALQGQLFLDAVRKWRDSGEPNDDLKELGGPFVAVAERAWVRDGKMILDDDELRLLFRVHWGKLTGLHRVDPFGPSLEEFRRYYLTNLQHPAGPPGDLVTQTVNQIAFVRALGHLESSYPAHLAEGILQLRLGQSLLAMKSLKTHLDEHPDGPWTHMARNHLILATRQADQIAKGGH